MAAGVLAAVALGAVVVTTLVDPSDDPSVRTANPAWLDAPPSGPVRFCGGDDVSDSQRRSERDYNGRFSGSKATFEAASFEADSQHDVYLKLIERGRDDCDVIFLDVIYMTEFAAKGLLYDMSPYLEQHERRADFAQQSMKSAEYEGKLWGVPKQLDVAAMYYRADRVRAPTSWQDVYRQAKRRRPDDLPGLRFQVGSNEALTVVFLELAYAAGARPIISEDGKTAEIDQFEVREALKFMRNAIRDGVIPDLEQGDKGNLDVYERGRASFLRGWPFVAARIEEDPNTKRIRRTRRARRTTAANTEIVPLPPWRPGGESVGVLGGHNLVIPRSAGNPSAALHLIDYLTSDAQVRKDEREDSQFPILTAVANDSDLKYRALIKAIRDTKVIPRPTIREYAEVSSIISSGVKAVLDGPADDASIQDKLESIDSEVQDELDSPPS